MPRQDNAIITEVAGANVVAQLLEGPAAKLRIGLDGQMAMLIDGRPRHFVGDLVGAEIYALRHRGGEAQPELYLLPPQLLPPPLLPPLFPLPLRIPWGGGRKEMGRANLDDPKGVAEILIVEVAAGPVTWRGIRARVGFHPRFWPSWRYPPQGKVAGDEGRCGVGRAISAVPV